MSKFEYISQGKIHSDTTREYMVNLGMNTETIESVEAQEQYEKERKWAEIRSTRDLLISKTDYTQVDDTPYSAEQKEAFALYRQALRDLPASTDNPYEIIFPASPVL